MLASIYSEFSFVKCKEDYCYIESILKDIYMILKNKVQINISILELCSNNVIIDKHFLYNTIVCYD